MAVNSTAVWRVRPAGNNLNGGGFDTGIAGHATDYSQQDAAQASGSNATCAQNTTTFIDATANAFTSAMVGNCIQIASGTNFIAGFYFVTAFTSASTVTLDRTPATAGAGSVGVWKLGGGWADYWTNSTAAKAALVPGNIVFVLGSGTPTPGAYVYDYTISTVITVVDGDAVNGAIVFANDPATPGYKAPPDTTGGMPLTKFSPGGRLVLSHHAIKGLWFSAAGLSAGNVAIEGTNTTTPGYLMFGCVGDQEGISAYFMGNFWGSAIGCEFFSSIAGTADANSVVYASNNAQSRFIGCNIHDAVSIGIWVDLGAISFISDTIVSKCGSDGVLSTTGQQYGISVKNCTIDGNVGNGINLSAQTDVATMCIFNNIISNQTGVGKSGINCAVGTAAQNTRIVFLEDYNVFYNNTADLTNINYGPHDTHGGSNPYVGQPTENYTLA